MILLLLMIAVLTFSPERLRMLYNSLDPTSIHEHLAFWELYPETVEGKRALGDIQRLLTMSDRALAVPDADLSKAVVGIVALVNKPTDRELPILSDETLDLMKKLGASLPNRQLKGSKAVSEEEVIQLPPEEIDLARGLLLSELGPSQLPKIESYEALLDLMALQIRARLSPGALDADKVYEMNRYIFEELGYRFPPHSAYTVDIDLYTFLPSVMDSHRGVCLGVSILYIALAQRLDLKLEMVTPPGHIYIRTKEINIETTARGIHLDSSVYLGVDTRSLEIRNIKEVIGMAHFNQAAIFWRKSDPKQALKCYERAYPYMKEDKHLLELMAYNTLLDGDEKKANEMLQQLKDWLPEQAVSPNTVIQDLLSGKADAEALRAIYQEVDENRRSLLEKKAKIEIALGRCPEFRAGWLSLAVTYLQLHRMKEALHALQELHRLDPNDATSEYYLSTLFAERLDYPSAWRHLRQAERLTAARNHFPKALKSLRRELALLYPEM
jgi:regulator of sirC expression with transglutaminase-like and TPR domain